MPDPMTITLAGTAYTVKPLTLGQIEDIGVALALPKGDDPQEEIRRSFRRSREILAAALGAEHPEMTADKLREIPVRHGEIPAAVDAVLDFSGLVKKESGQGEAPAAA